MSSSTKNLALLGALFVNSVAEINMPRALLKVVNKAKGEISEKLDEEQFDLYEAAGDPEIRLILEGKGGDLSTDCCIHQHGERVDDWPVRPIKKAPS